MNQTTISLGSVTNAIKARKMLSGLKIHSKLVKLDVGKGLDGCIYGLTIFSSDYPNAARELKKEGIIFSLYL